MKKLLWSILFSLVLVSLSIALFRFITANNSVASANILTSKYNIAVTFTDLKYDSNYYLIDLSNKKSSLLYKQPKSDFDVFTLSARTNSIFYNKFDSNLNMQLFEFDLSSKREVQITRNLIIVDFMYCDDSISQMYLRVVQKDHRNFQIAVYNIKSNKLNIWNTKDEDTSVKAFDYDPVSKRVIEATYSLNEQYEKTDKANRNHEPMESLNYNISLCNKDGNKLKNICTTNKDVATISLERNGNNALVDLGNNGSSNISRSVDSLDINDGSIKPYLPESDLYENFQYAQFSPDNKSVYLLANRKGSAIITDRTGTKIEPKYLVHFDCATQKYSLVWEKSDGIMNYFSILQ